MTAPAGPRILSYPVRPEDAERRVQDILMKRYGYSVRMVRRLKQLPRAVTLDGVPARMIDRAQAGSLLAVTLPEDGPPQAAGERTIPPENTSPIPVVPIAYEDEDVLVYQKPPFLAIHPCRDHSSGTLAEVFCRDMRERGCPQPVFRPVYRLDRDTDGLCVIAKNALAAAQLARRIQKEYTAIACGRVEPPIGSIDAPIAQLEPHRMKRGIREDGQRAVTHYETVLYTKQYTLLKIRLETGRTHQIRVHFASIGHPLAGDSLYGGACAELSRQALTCTKAAFRSPGTGRLCEICINMQPELARLLHNE